MRTLLLLWLLGAFGVCRAEDPAQLVANIADVESAKRLQALGKDALPALLGGLDGSEHKDVILSLLGEIGDASVLPALLKHTGDSVIEHRLAACYALRTFKDPEATAGASKLLADSADRVRIAALHALLAQNAASAVPAVCKLLEDPEWPVRKESARVLGELKAKAAAGALVKRLHFELVEEPSPADKPKTDQPKLVPKYVEPVSAVRMECIRSLGKLGAPEAVEGFLPLFAWGTSAEREAAVQAIEQIGAQAADPLHRSLQLPPQTPSQQPPEIARNAYIAVSLARLRDERAVRPAIDLLPAADPFAQIELIRFLGERKSAEAAPKLVEMLKASGVQQIHDALAEALRKIGKPASEALLEALPNRAACVEVMKLLEKPELHNPKAVPQLLKHLEDEEYDIRLGAVTALAAHQVKEAVPAIESVFVVDPDERVREAAADALKALTGKDYRK
jgi:HEAT repeat protein